jgi:hypothetical protein
VRAQPVAAAPKRSSRKTDCQRRLERLPYAQEAATAFRLWIEGGSQRPTCLSGPDSIGSIQIKVDLYTTRALGFAQSIKALRQSGFDFLNTPTIFGAKAQDVVAGAAAAVGEAHLSTTFSIAVNADLPDLVDVLVNNTAQYAPVTVNFTSTTCGSYPDGSKSLLKVNEVGATNDKGKLIYSTETIETVSDATDCQ